MSDWWWQYHSFQRLLDDFAFFMCFEYFYIFLYLLIIFQIFTSKPAKMLETIFRTCCDSKMLASINLNSITSHHRRRRGLISRTPWTFSSVFNLSMQCFILVIFLRVSNIIIFNTLMIIIVATLTLLCEYIINCVRSFIKLKRST